MAARAVPHYHKIRERTCGPDTGVERFDYDGLERLVAWYRPLPGQEGNQNQFVWKVGYAIDELSNVTARDVFEQNNANRVQHLVYHYDRDDHGCDDLLISGETFLHWWTDHRDDVRAALCN